MKVEEACVNQPEVFAEVSRVFHRYETALVANDVSALNDFFWDSGTTVRYGVAEHCYGIEAIRLYRRNATPVDPKRRLRHTIITTFGSDFASVCTEFLVPGEGAVGRQTQTWVRFADGWKIVAAHVSTIPAV